jgi:hypothetical protein
MIRKNKALECDVPGCKSRILATGSGARFDRAKWLRSKALEQGWTRDEWGGDRCPGHVIPRAMEAVPGSASLAEAAAMPDKPQPDEIPVPGRPETPPTPTPDFPEIPKPQEPI